MDDASSVDDNATTAVSANLSSLSDIGQAWLHADHSVWFSAMDISGDVEPYQSTEPSPRGPSMRLVT